MNRRSFTRNLALTGTAFALSPAILSAQQIGFYEEWTSPQFGHKVSWDARRWTLLEDRVVSDPDNDVDHIELQTANALAVIESSLIANKGLSTEQWLDYWQNPTQLVFIAGDEGEVVAQQATKSSAAIILINRSYQEAMFTMLDVSILDANVVLFTRVQQTADATIAAYRHRAAGLSLNDASYPLVWSVSGLIELVTNTPNGLGGQAANG